MTQVLIDRSTLEQLVRMLEQCLDDAIQVQCDLEQGYSKSLALAQMVQVELSKEALTAGRAALANAEPTGFSLTNTSISDTSRTIESFFEAMDKEVAAGRLVRTGPMEWTKL